MTTKLVVEVATSFSASILVDVATLKHPLRGFEQPLTTSGKQGMAIG